MVLAAWKKYHTTSPALLSKDKPKTFSTKLAQRASKLLNISFSFSFFFLHIHRVNDPKKVAFFLKFFYFFIKISIVYNLLLSSFISPVCSFKLSVKPAIPF